MQGKGGQFEGDPSAWALQLSAKGSEQAPLDLKQELQVFKSTCKQLGTELVERNEQIKGDPMWEAAAGCNGAQSAARRSICSSAAAAAGCMGRASCPHATQFLSSHKFLDNWPGVLWQGTSAAAQPSAKPGRLARALLAAKQNKSCASCSAVWRGQAEREQQQAKQLEQQLHETQGSTQTLEQQASLMPVPLAGGCNTQVAFSLFGSIC